MRAFLQTVILATLKGYNIKKRNIQTINRAKNFNPNNGVVVLIDHTSSVLLLGKWVIVEYQKRTFPTISTNFV